MTLSRVSAIWSGLSLKLLALDLVSLEYRRQKKDLWLNVCLYWAEKLMNVNCNNLLNIDAFEIGSLKKLINNQDGSIVVGGL